MSGDTFGRDGRGAELLASCNPNRRAAPGNPCLVASSLRHTGPSTVLFVTRPGGSVFRLRCSQTVFGAVAGTAAFTALTPTLLPRVRSPASGSAAWAFLGEPPAVVHDGEGHWPAPRGPCLESRLPRVLQRPGQGGPSARRLPQSRAPGRGQVSSTIRVIVQMVRCWGPPDVHRGRQPRAAPGAFLRASSPAAGRLRAPPRRRSPGGRGAPPAPFPSASFSLARVGPWSRGFGVFSNLGSLTARRLSSICRVSAVCRAVPRRVLWGVGCPAVRTATSFCLAPSRVSGAVGLPRPTALAPAPFSLWRAVPAAVRAHVLVPALLRVAPPGGPRRPALPPAGGGSPQARLCADAMGTRLGRLPLTHGDLAPGWWAPWGCRVLSRFRFEAPLGRRAQTALSAG